MSRTSSARKVAPAPENAAGSTAEAQPGPLESPERLPLKNWSLEFVRRWNGGTYSLFVLHGNVFDLFPVKKKESGVVDYVPLQDFLVNRFFFSRSCVLYYDISEGLTCAKPEMQFALFKWLQIYDTVHNTDYHQAGLPREFVRLAPVFRSFFQHVAEHKEQWPGVTLIVHFPEKLIPATEEANASTEERMNLVTFLRWASDPIMSRHDIGVVLLAESASELNPRLLQNPHVAQVRIDLPDKEDRFQYLQSNECSRLVIGKPAEEWSELPMPDLAARTAGLNLLRIRHLVAESVCNGARLTSEAVAGGKKRLIEEYCQGLVRFKDPKPGVSLDRVATHEAAKKRLRELAWLIRNGKGDVLERGILVPGRVGVGKSFLIDCFASECGLPVMEIGEFRSKWVGDTERQQMRILITVRALGPVIVVVDEADAVFGTRDAESGDSGVSSRVFAAFAAHIGDATLRGRELWVAMTSRPDLLAIDMKRQGRFGLCIPLFPAQDAEEVLELFRIIAAAKQITLTKPTTAYVKETLGALPLTGSDVESILIRAKEKAVLAKRDMDVRKEDLQEAVSSFIDPLDPNLLALQELAAVLACSDRRYLPEKYAKADRGELLAEFGRLRIRSGRFAA